MRAVDEAPEYLAAHIAERLAEDGRTSEQGISVRVTAGHVMLTGTVATAERRDEIGRVAASLAPAYVVCNHIAVLPCAEPQEPERLG